MKVLYVRFLKGRYSSEDEVLEKIGIPVKRSQQSEKFVIQMGPEEKLKTRDETKTMMKFISMNAHKYDMIVLDEIIDLCADNVNFFTENQLIEFINSLGDKEILMSGHTKLDNLFNEVDLISEFKPTKHYFEKGIKARKGIEY